MNGLVLARLLVLVLGMLAIGYGVRTNEETWRWVGMGCVAASLVLRLIGRVTARR
ncbi:MAG: hypothetical protein HY275_10785 [Gemmatimonadetes bacterium]|nr:hypothetical protein [Gemmatimonadota bacterium]